MNKLFYQKNTPFNICYIFLTTHTLMLYSQKLKREKYSATIYQSHVSIYKYNNSIKIV